jgi:hypothetical protein
MGELGLNGLSFDARAGPDGGAGRPSGAGKSTALSLIRACMMSVAGGSCWMGWICGPCGWPTCATPLPMSARIRCCSTCRWPTISGWAGRVPRMPKSAQRRGRRRRALYRRAAGRVRHACRPRRPAPVGRAAPARGAGAGAAARSARAAAG